MTMTKTIAVVTSVSLRVGQVTFFVSERTSLIKCISEKRLEEEPAIVYPGINIQLPRMTP